MPVIDYPITPVPATPPRPHHFFGYYDKSPWSTSGRWMLALETDFMDRTLTGVEPAQVGWLKPGEDALHIFDETRAWCWQQGCMLQWLPGDADRRVVYNKLEGDRTFAVIRDIHTGHTRDLSHPIYALSPCGTKALFLNFGRLAVTRPGYGYPGARPPSPGALACAPHDDGIWSMDLATGRAGLIISLAQLVSHRPLPSMPNARMHWVNHLQFNTDGTRFAFVHRWARPDHNRWHTRMLTANADGSDLFVLNDHDLFSHYDWMTPTTLAAWCRDARGIDGYQLITDRTGDHIPLGQGLFTGDGHCSFSPDRNWLLTDTYPDSRLKRNLMLYRLRDRTRFNLASLATTNFPVAELRCDLHPRWRRDGKAVCIDSTHEGVRRMYTLDVTPIIELQDP